METEQLTVTGMTCGGCVTKVTRALKATAGVGDVKVSLASGKATVQYDKSLVSPGQLKSAVEGAGYGVNGTNVTPDQQSKEGCCG